MDRYDQECKHQFPLGDWPTVAKMMRRAHAEGEKEAEQALAEAQDKLEAAKVSYAKETHDRIEAESEAAAAQRELAKEKMERRNAERGESEQASHAEALAAELAKQDELVGVIRTMLEDVGYSEGRIIDCLEDVLRKYEALIPERDTAQAESFCAKKEASDLRAQNEKAESLLAAEREKVRVMRGIAMDLHQAFNCVVTIGVPVRKGRIYDSTWQEYGKALTPPAGEPKEKI